MNEIQKSFIRCVLYIALKLLVTRALFELCKMQPQEFIDEEKISEFWKISLMTELYDVKKNEQNMFVILMRSLATGSLKKDALHQIMALYTLNKIFRLPLGFVVNFALMTFYKLSLQYVLMLTVTDYVDASATSALLSFSQFDLIESNTALIWIALKISASTIFEMCKDGILQLLH